MEDFATETRRCHRLENSSQHWFGPEISVGDMSRPCECYNYERPAIECGHAYIFTLGGEGSGVGGLGVADCKGHHSNYLAA